MLARRLPFWAWLTASHLLALALPAAAFLGSGVFAIDLVRQTRKSLEHQALLLELLVRAEVEHARQQDPAADLARVAPRLQPAIEEFAAQSYAGVRLIGPDGRVRASTGPMLGVDLSSRPEVREALAGREGWIQRARPPEAPDREKPARSPEEGPRIYVATPLRAGPEPDAEVLGALLISRTPRRTWQVLANMGPRLDLSLAIALGVTLAMSVGLGRAFSRPIERLQAAARRLSEGRLEGGPARETAAWSQGDADLAQARASAIREVAGLGEDLGRMADRLQARLGYIAEFAGNVSHEFKTPLSTLRGTLELLEDEPEMPAEQRARFLENALEEVSRARRLVDGLLALARADQARRRAPLDLDLLLRQQGQDRPAVQVESRVGWILGDSEQLDAAISNLVDNALLHGGPEVRVAVRGLRREDMAVVEVEDDGPGIPEALRSRIFERFFTTAREAGGTGLGLALVQLVAEAHGGAVEVESQPGRTVFRLLLRAEALHGRLTGIERRDPAGEPQTR